MKNGLAVFLSHHQSHQSDSVVRWVLLGRQGPEREPDQLVPRGSSALRGLSGATAPPSFEQGGLPGTGRCARSSPPSAGSSKLEQDGFSLVNSPKSGNTAINDRSRENLPCRITTTTMPPPLSRLRAMSTCRTRGGGFWRLCLHGRVVLHAFSMRDRGQGAMRWLSKSWVMRLRPSMHHPPWLPPRRRMRLCRPG